MINQDSNMSHTYISDLVHCVFSTKLRRNLISPEVQPELWSFLGGVARKNGFKALMVGGTENHVHLLLSLPATMTVAKAMQLVKGASSHWMNENHTKTFAWQEGYGAFTIGISQKNHTIQYIRSQAEHHRKRSFEEEFVAFLKKHGVEYDRQIYMGIDRAAVSSVPPGRGSVLWAGDPALETPGYCQTVPPGPALVAEHKSGLIYTQIRGARK
jgi:putative transposase